MKQPLATVPPISGEPLTVMVTPGGVVVDSLFPIAPPMNAAAARESARRLLDAADRLSLHLK